MRLFLSTLLISPLLIPAWAAAQSLDGIGAGPAPSFSISTTPENPLPFSSATLNFSTSLETNNATLTVRVDGKTIYQGSVKPVEIQTGRAGATSRIAASLATPSGSYSAALSLIPQDVVLVAEPLATVPPLYPGKPSVSFDGTIRMVALASLKSAGGGAIDPSSLSYIWTVDDTQLDNSSGIGKNVLVVSSPFQYRIRTVSVVATTPDGTFSGSASVSLSATEPHVRIYNNDPLLGIRFERALTDAFTIHTAEQSFYGGVFSFPLGNGAPSSSWFLNGESAQAGNTITLRPTGSGQGDASLSFVTSGGDTSTASANLSIIFGASGSNFFGL